MKGKWIGGLKIAGFVLLDLAVSNIVVFGIVAVAMLLQVLRVALGNGTLYQADLIRIQQQMFTEPNMMIFLNIASALAILLVFGTFYVIMNRKKYGNFHMRFAETKGNMLFLFLLAVSLQFAISILLNLILPLFPRTMENYAELMNQLQVGQTLLAFIYTVLIAPAAEEITYRGVILRVGEKAFSRPVAVVIQALLFGVMHWNLVQGVYAFLLGLLLGYICVKRDSIWPAILLHLFTNLASFLVEPVMGVFSNWSQILLLLLGSVVIGFLSFRNMDFEA